MTRHRHGMSKTKIYGIWLAMRSRCENPRSQAYNDYGGRGIAVCERWKLFENFHADMGDRPDGLSLERIDNDGGYAPENCMWASRRQQNLNQRNRRWITAAGKTASIVEWSELTGLSVGTIWARLKKGWPEDRAVLTKKITLRKGIKRGVKLHAYGAEHGVVWTDEMEAAA